MNPSYFEIITHAALVILVNGLWQGLAIAGLTWLALRAFPRANASTRYAAWTLALIAVLIVPIGTSLSRIAYERPATTSTAHAVTEHGVGARHVFAPARTGERQTAPATIPQAPGKPFFSMPQMPSVHLAPPQVVTTIVFALWGLAALALVVRLGVALLRLERLKRDALPLRIEYRDHLAQWERIGRDNRDVRICVTGGIEVPVAVGLFDAMVLLPQHLLDELDPKELEQISLHELAHLLRHDDWTNGLQRVITALLFFNPAVWFIARQMDVEREVACDDYVLELTGQVRSYAYCLTKMAEMTAWPHQPLAAPGVFTTRKNISIRIERLLRTGRAISSSISPATAGAVAVGLLAGFFLARQLTPEIAFAMPDVTVPAVPAPIVASTTAPAKPVPHAPAIAKPGRKRPAR